MPVRVGSIRDTHRFLQHAMTQAPIFIDACYVQDALDPSAAAEVVACCLLQPDATVTVVSCFRPILLYLLDYLPQQQSSETDAAGQFIALVLILESTPYLERYVLLSDANSLHTSASLIGELPCCRTLVSHIAAKSQSALQQLSALNEPKQAIALVRATWRLLQLLPSLQTSWTAASLYSTMLHKVRTMYCIHQLYHTDALHAPAIAHELIVSVSFSTKTHCIHQL